MPGGCSPEQPVIGAVACQRVLYAQAEDRWVNCRDCGSTWDVRGRRELLMRRAEDELAPVAVIAQLAATITGETSVGKIEARIRKWVERNRIKAVTTKVIEGRERRVYRVGDVLDLLADTPTTNNTNRSA